MPKLLALDIARVTGWAVIATRDRHAACVEASGALTIGTGKWAEDWSRAHKDAWAAEQLAAWVHASVARDGPCALVLEEPFVAPQRTNAARALWLLRGAALVGARTAAPRIAVIDAPIRAWQTWAAGALGWSKIKGRKGDEADARAIGLWAANLTLSNGENK
jgi:hypothetical protein